MNKNEPTYESVSKYLSDEEIVESYVFRSTMTVAEKEAAEAEFRKLRFEQLKNMSDEQRLKGELFRMQLLMDDYFKQTAYIETFSFANQLKAYIDLLKKTHTSFAKDIGIHKTKLSRILNNKEKPNIELMYRLERHSGKMLPAIYWFRLHTKQLENRIKKDEEKRLEEYGKVRNELCF